MNVAIIGAGYAGMAAGVALAEAGVPVTIYEAGLAPGGRARRVEIEGVALDNGMHILLGAYRDTLAMMRKVGQPPERVLLRSSLDLTIHPHFRLTAAPLPAPLHLAFGLLRARGASWHERWSAARFLAAMRRRGYALANDCPVAALLARNGQSERFIRHLWAPLCLAALNTPPERASARVFLHVLRDGLDAGRAASDILLSRVDLTALFPEPAARYVAKHGGEVRLQEAVTAVTHAGGRFRVHTRRGGGEHTHVVCATSPHHAAALVRELPGTGEVAAALDGLRYQPIYTIYLQYEEPVSLPQPMLGLAAGTAHWLFDRGAISGETGLVAGVVSAAGPHTRLAHESVALRVQDDVRQVLGRAPALRWSRVIAEKRATFECAVDVRRPSQRTALPGLLMAGDYTAGDYPGTLEAAVRSGLAGAKAVLR